MPSYHNRTSTRITRRGALLLLLASACVSGPPTVPTTTQGSVILSASSSDVFEGDVFSMHALVRDGAGHDVLNPSITWTSADTSVARVNAAGDVTSLKPGTARIVAKSGDASATLSVDIQRLTVMKVAVLALPDTMGSGDVALFGVQVMGQGGRGVQGRPITVTSSNPQVALIDATERVRAVSAGTTMITATVDGVTGSAQLVVTNSPAVGGGATVPSNVFVRPER